MSLKVYVPRWEICYKDMTDREIDMLVMDKGETKYSSLNRLTHVSVMDRQ